MAVDPGHHNIKVSICPWSHNLFYPDVQLEKSIAIVFPVLWNSKLEGEMHFPLKAKILHYKGFPFLRFQGWRDG